jgi:glucan biosynthesis protein C
MRAAMMLLGVILHSALPYAKYTLGVVSAYHDLNDSYLLSIVTFLTHMFRMPAFFLVAGFFGGMLFKKLGGKGLLRNRAKRILLPLVVSWVILFPLTILGAAFTVLGGPEGVSRVIQQLQSGALLAKNNMTFADLLTQLGLIHLWFLYYLMVYYIVVVALIRLIRGIPQQWIVIIMAIFIKLVKHPAGIIVFAAITFFTMLDMPIATSSKAGFENSNALLPHLPVLAAYLVFFVFGWLLFNHEGLINSFSKKTWPCLVGGLWLSVVYSGLVLYPSWGAGHVVQIAVASMATWLLVFGVTGLFIRYAGKPSTAARYFADASYWVYLVHLPLTLFLPGFFIGIDIPGIVKFLLVVIITLCISLVTYHYFVRSTIIGKVLNGRRYVKALPVRL